MLTPLVLTLLLIMMWFNGDSHSQQRGRLDHLIERISGGNIVAFSRRIVNTGIGAALEHTSHGLCTLLSYVYRGLTQD